MATARSGRSMMHAHHITCQCLVRDEYSYSFALPYPRLVMPRKV